MRQQQWPALIAWVVIVVAALIAMPNVSALVREQGAVHLPATAQSTVAERLQKQANGNKAVRTYTAVFSNGDAALSAKQSRAVTKTLDALHDTKRLTVTSVLAPSANAETKKQLIASDKTTQLAQITVKKRGTVSAQVRALEAQLHVAGLKTYVTGVDALNNEFSTVTEKGIQKTELIAVVFIFVVLILVFHSPITPLVSLLNVGVAFITSLSVVMNLAAHAGFPISNFTQVFLVVVLFGIGTDYNILLYDEFKGALAAGLSPVDAMRETRRRGGRTVLYSGLSVLIGFSVLWLAKFSFYQSASAVAIGVLVLLPVLLTLNMFFMATLGPKLFWPSKVASGASSSRLWHGLSKAALARPVVVLVALVALAVPFVATLGADESFNNADEVPDNYPSKAGYVLIQKHFSKGMSAPATIYIKSKTRLDTPAKLAALDDLTRYLQREPGVKTVASVTEPGGSKIDSMYLRAQLTTITDGLAQSQAGLAQIKAGLNGATTQLAAADLTGSLSQVQQLADGTAQLAGQTSKLSSGVKQYTAGVATAAAGAQSLQQATQQAASGSATLADGTATMAASVQTMTGALPALTSQLQTLQGGTGELATQMTKLNTAVAQLGTVADQLSGMMPLLAAATHGALTADTIQTLVTSVAQLSDGATTLNAKVSGFTTAIPGLTSQVGRLVDGTQALASGATKLASGNEALATGAAQLSAGASRLTGQSGQLTSGTAQLATANAQVNGAVQQMNTQLQGMAAKLTTLQTGLGAATQGLTTLAKGSSAMDQYLSGLRDSYMGDQFYLPSASIHSAAFKPALDTYLKAAGKITTLTVVFTGDPNSAEVDRQFTTLSRDLKAQLKHGALAGTTVAIGGQTAQDHDLRSLAKGDFERTATIMVIGIGLALIVVTQSLLQPLTILATLLAAYASAMGLTRWFSTLLLGRTLLSWNTPFFTFIMLMALGVDYSIFLMIRYRDDRETPALSLRMNKAATAIGAVVLSAAVILSGTFAALIPSGVTTLIQVALGVIIGLIVLVITLPLSLSALIALSEQHEQREHGEV
ncbi:MMPL family transporter [Lacticaseibacillus absianus]|uniref:MMPL family transporter n=1 Tax=Lacticaseibacillus absianus TaxID=2729623 RepID=UPI001FEC666F|nr:MMPL family transporter [Lacticaseibacillus absianus]